MWSLSFCIYYTSVELTKTHLESTAYLKECTKLLYYEPLTENMITFISEMYVNDRLRCNNRGQNEAKFV